jgi:hypothetical protein
MKSIITPTINGANKVYGGYIYNLNVNRSTNSEAFQVTANIISSGGDYQISDTDLSKTIPVNVGVGNLTFQVYPVSFEKSVNGNEKTLAVNYVDTSIVLDSKYVGLPYLDGDPSGVNPVSNIILMPTLDKGTLTIQRLKQLAADGFQPSGQRVYYSGLIEDATRNASRQLPEYIYNLPTMISGIQQAGIAFDTSDVEINNYSGYYVSNRGTVRSALSQILGDLGLGFYWYQNKVKIIDLKTDVSFDTMKQYVDGLGMADVNNYKESQSIDENINRVCVGSYRQPASEEQLSWMGSSVTFVSVDTAQHLGLSYPTQQETIDATIYHLDQQMSSYNASAFATIAGLSDARWYYTAGVGAVAIPPTARNSYINWTQYSLTPMDGGQNIDMTLLAAGRFYYRIGRSDESDNTNSAFWPADTLVSKTPLANYCNVDRQSWTIGQMFGTSIGIWLVERNPNIPFHLHNGNKYRGVSDLLAAFRSFLAYRGLAEFTSLVYLPEPADKGANKKSILVRVNEGSWSQLYNAFGNFLYSMRFDIITDSFHADSTKSQNDPGSILYPRRQECQQYGVSSVNQKIEVQTMDVSPSQVFEDYSQTVTDSTSFAQMLSDTQKYSKNFIMQYAQKAFQGCYFRQTEPLGQITISTPTINQVSDSSDLFKYLKTLSYQMSADSASVSYTFSNRYKLLASPDVFAQKMQWASTTTNKYVNL